MAIKPIAAAVLVEFQKMIPAITAARPLLVAPRLTSPAAGARTHGGKLIQYHGWNDPAIPPRYSLDYHARVVAKLGPSSDFYRLFMIPGMLHCTGGAGPGDVDWQTLIENWVERGSTPTIVSATSDADYNRQAIAAVPYAGNR
jgi:hypothetical protein